MIEEKSLLLVIFFSLFIKSFSHIFLEFHKLVKSAQLANSNCMRTKK